MTYSHHERLSAVDAAFLAVEDDCAHMHIGSVSLFEMGPLRAAGGGLDVERIRSLVDAQLHRIPRFRQKLAAVPLTGAPVWVDDPTFNLDYHLRHTALPHPGDTAALQRLTSRIFSQHLDRRRPLWETWLVEGLEGDRFAMVSKLHHALADGISGVDLAGALIGRDPDYRPEPAPSWIPRPTPSVPDLLGGEVRHRVGAALGLVRGAVPRSTPDDGGAGARRPARAPGLGDRLRRTVTALAAAVETAPPTPLNTTIGPNRRFAWLRTDLARVREIREAAGGTLNDVALAVVAGAVRAFLGRRGCNVRGLDFRVMVPVSVRTPDERGRLGNRVSQLVVHLPLEEEDPLGRLRRVVDATRELKRSGQAQGGEALTSLSELLPPRLAAVLERAAARRSFGNMIVTNVPGAPETAYMLGARLLESYPLVPLAPDQALNLALLSYDGGLHWGVNADWDAVPDVADFVVLLAREMDALHAAASALPRRPAEAGPRLVHAG